MTYAQKHIPWRPLGQTGVHYWRVQRMAKSCGVDTALASANGDLNSRDWAAAVQRCRSCQWVDGCERWLDRHDKASKAAPPERCLNAGLLRNLTERQDHAD
ncbi:DUF6455 family protein [Marivita sp. XM-24bin2]|uniref:DUF6455 family protein n=1 Tax=unclassified Marivita TaxID=2632480 RepID=UPI000D7A0762|nr:DUF6455 family protein [Marivita sp. XM-24bin2]MCR9109677.1 DUF6455 family protein [Paracoccaceae bacterium]PWL34995.1 MAG: hypothetical protein DCO97_11525 [Marivita sp. XM-24bin2]